MYYYFSAKFASILKINGVYYGEINQTTKRVEILECNSFIEVCPLELEHFPFSFILNDNFLISPPKNICVVDLKGGYLIEFNFLQDNSAFAVLVQEKFNYAVATVFKENGLKVSIETPNDFFAETISFPAESAKITPFSLRNCRLIAITFLGTETLLNCYLLENNIQKVFSKTVSGCSFNNGFCSTEEFLDIAKHTLTIHWDIEENKLIKRDFSLSRAKDFCIDTLPEHLIAYAFLEELLCGGDTIEYLAENVKENKDFLVGFFGEFLGVMPPPDFREFDELGLIYKCAENKYKVEYFKFELQDKKICNIKKTS
ncbi:MAG: hypothetical protein J6V71_00490 [Clostridia bacterium]|nr:hypothetical protein [Clostridia bacterium]